MAWMAFAGQKEGGTENREKVPGDFSCAKTEGLVRKYLEKKGAGMELGLIVPNFMLNS